MKRSFFVKAWLYSLIWVTFSILAGCSPSSPPTPTPSTSSASATKTLDTLALWHGLSINEGKTQLLETQKADAPSKHPLLGFEVGNAMAPIQMVIFFDAQCPHCGHLWQAADGLKTKVYSVWIPVQFINKNSLLQGAAILNAPHPAEQMALHEKLLLTNKLGLPTTELPPPSTHVTTAIQKNTEWLTKHDQASVPFGLARLASGQVVTIEGGLEQAALAQKLGL